jgi:hypothetical protein
LERKNYFPAAKLADRVDRSITANTAPPNPSFFHTFHAHNPPSPSPFFNRFFIVSYQFLTTMSFLKGMPAYERYLSGVSKGEIPLPAYELVSRGVGGKPHDWWDD